MQMAAEKIEAPAPFYFTDPERRIFKAREKISVSQWAGKYRYIAKGKAVIGRWSNELTPYAVEPMDTWALPWVRKVILCWAPQTGKTQVAFNCMMYAVDIDPGPAMYIMADEKTAKRISRRQIIPSLRATPKVADLLGPRADDVSTLLINFSNGMDIMLAWATSAAQMASESVRYLFLDEPGKYPEFVGKEADPFSLLDVRQNIYQYTSKTLIFSTPAIDGDPFDMLLKEDPDEVRHYEARCPFCNKYQVMEFEQIHWGGVKDHRQVNRKKLGRYTCIKCGMDWDDYTRNEAVKRGRWKAEKPVERPECIAFSPLPSWYSPFVSLSRPAANFLKGQQNPKKLQAFVTQDQCQSWKEVVKTQPESELLKHKVDLPPGIVPAWAVALTCGIDVQKLGFWFVVRAWDGELNSHLVQYGYLSTFDDVKTLVFETYFQRENSKEKLLIWRAVMDTGGGETDEGDWSRTEEIYMFIKTEGQGKIHATKGASRAQFARVNPPKPIERLPRSNKRIPGGLELRTIDTFDLKKLLHWRLTRRIADKKDENENILPAESQRFTLHADTGQDYAQQFLAEELRKDRRGKYEWKKIRRDNHLLDCEVLAAACADNSWFPNLVGLANYQKGKRRQDATADTKKKIKKAGTVAQAIKKGAPGSRWMNIG